MSLYCNPGSATLQNEISISNFITLKSFFFKFTTICLCYTRPKFLYLFLVLKNKKMGAKLDKKKCFFFTIVVPVKIAFLGSCQQFQEIIILPTWLCRTKINDRSMPKRSDLGQLKLKWINVWMLRPRISPFVVIFYSHIEKHQTNPVN